MQSLGAVVGANRMVQVPLLVPAPEKPVLPETAWVFQRILTWAPGMRVSRHCRPYPNIGLGRGIPVGNSAPLGTLKVGGKGCSGVSWWDHTLIPWPPLDGQLRPRPLSAGRRAVSVHEDQLQAPIGKGKTPPCVLEYRWEGVGSRAPFVALVLGGDHWWHAGLRNQRARRPGARL